MSPDMSIVISAVNDASNILKQVQSDVKKLDSNIKSDLKSTSDSFKSSGSIIQGSLEKAKSTVNSFAQSIGPALLTATKIGLAGLVALGAYGLKTAADIEQTRISFDVLTGSAEKGKQLMGDLVDMSAKTPFESWDLQKNAQLLLNYSVKLEDILPTLGMLGDISAGNAEKLSGLTLSFSQIASTGRLTGQDLLQMINNGFNPLQVISQKTGESMADLKERMEDGRISFDEVKGAMEDVTSEGGRFYNMMDKQSNSAWGLYSTLKDSLSIALNEMIGITKDGEIIPGSIFELAKNKIKEAGERIDKNKDKIMLVGDVIGTIVVGAFTVLSTVIGNLITVGSYVISTFEKYPILFYTIGGAIFAVLLPSIIGAIGSFGAMAIAAASAAVATLAAIWPLILIGAVIGAMIYGVKVARESNFLGIRDKTQAVVSRFTSYVGPAMQSTRDSVVLIFERAKSMIMSTIDILIGAFTGDWDRFNKGIQGVWDGMRTAIYNILGGTINKIRSFLIASMISISEIWNQGRETVKNFFVDVKNQIVGEITALVSNMKESGYNAIKMLGDGIMSGIDYVKNAVNTVANTIKQYLGFASPTEMGAASDSDRWAPNLMKMFADGMAGGIPLIRDQASSVAENIRLGFDKLKYIDIKGPMKEKLDGIKQSLSNFRDATGQQLPEIVQKYNDFKQGISDTLSKLKTDYDKKVSDIANKAREVQNTIADLNKQMTSDTNSDQLSIAQKYVEEQQKIEDIQKEIADKQKEKEQDLLDGGTTTSQDRYDEELAQLQEKLTAQQRIVSDNAFIETEYATQYAEAKKQADMDELTRFVYLTQQRMAQRQMEFEDKKAKLTQELIALIAQQAQVRIEYESSREAIERTMDQASVAYYERLENQKAWTKKATDDMASYFNNVTDAINDMLAAQAQSGGGGGGIYRAFGGMVTDHDVQTARYAVGGIVQGANGIDRVPAYLSAGELVLNRAQQSNLARQLGPNNGGGITLIVNVDAVYGEDDDYIERIGNKLVKQLKVHTGIESF